MVVVWEPFLDNYPLQSSTKCSHSAVMRHSQTARASWVLHMLEDLGGVRALGDPGSRQHLTKRSSVTDRPPDQTAFCTSHVSALGFDQL